MVEFEVLPLPASLVDASAAVQRAAEELGLTIATEGSLSKFKGSRHWHLKRSGRAGTLEATYWPAGGRFWVCYHSNRVGDGWVTDAAPKLANALSESMKAR